MLQKKLAIIEGILFAAGEPVAIEDLASVLETDTDKTWELSLRLMSLYERNSHGIRILRLEDSIQMTTDPSVYPSLIKLVSRPRRYRLTEVLMETLSIIVYKQPITRAEIERIRGVSCSHAIERLTEYGLIEEAGRLQLPGRPMTYRTTDEFLRCFPIETLDNLPDLPKEEEEQIRQDVQEEVGVYSEDAESGDTKDSENGREDLHDGSQDGN